MIRSDRGFVDARGVTLFVVTSVGATGLLTIPLTDGSLTPSMVKELMEGRTLRLNVLPILDDQFTALTAWSQLELISASAKIEYESTSDVDARANIGNNDLSSGFGAGRIWRGEVEDEADIPATTNGVWYVVADQDFKWRPSPGGALLGVSSNANSFQPSSTWLGHRTFDNVQTYFETNTYSSLTNYYYYDTGATEVRKFTRTPTTIWTELTSGGEFDDVAGTELTLDTSSLLSGGIVELSLSGDSIDEDKIDQFRLNIELSD